MNNLPICRLTLFSSGVGFFEHRGTVTGTTELSLLFHINAVNDALKSLVVNDPAGSPAVSYQSEETLSRTLKSLSVDLSGKSMYSLLRNLAGAKVEVHAPDSIKGRIIFVERKNVFVNNVKVQKTLLSLRTKDGIKSINMEEISSLSFNDPEITEDLNRALDLVMQARNDDTRNLLVKLSGDTERDVGLNYVIPTALWKVSYRLDLSREKPFLQGWAIVDNDSDVDWENVELALVTGKPVSFIQKLYDIHRLPRPIVPLSIEKAAEARAYDSGSPNKAVLKNFSRRRSTVREDISQSFSDVSSDEYDEDMSMLCEAEESVDEDDEYGGITGGLIETADTRQAGDQFEFTIKKPVSLARRQSAMLPLVEGDIESEKFLVFSNENIGQNCVANPAISAELTNNTGIKLPAGPITVYDGKTYAGDALIKFFPEGEKRIISYGEDLSVTGSYAQSNSVNISSVTITNGFMTLTKKRIYETVYTFRNAGKESKKLIIEHLFSFKSNLIQPLEYREKTHNLYRFMETLPPTSEMITFTVKEEETEQHEYKLFDFSYNKLAQYISNSDISQEDVIKALQKAMTLKKKISEAETIVENLQKKLDKRAADQERTRKNLEAAGNQSQQGKDYLQRLAKEDAAIDALEEEISAAENGVETAEKEYERYLMKIKI
ncbi:MAG: hypothetical protein FWD40_05525 [Treponema sp.]|nr:hypothetical protein [Treponema sp.]